MFLNVKRTHNNKLPESTLLKEFADTFRQEIWMGQRLPEVFYDRSSPQVQVQKPVFMQNALL